MLRRVAISLLLIVLLLFQFSVLGSFASPSHVTLTTLYAHAQPGAGNPILNAVPEWGPQQAARLQESDAIFSLDPPLGKDVVIDGTTTIRLWLRSDLRLMGSLAVYLGAQRPDGTSFPLHPMFNDTIFIDTRARDFNYLVGLRNLTLTEGSRLNLHVRFTSLNRVTGAYLLYDSQSSPTQITVPIQDSINTVLRFSSASGEAARILETEKGAPNATVLAYVHILDSLGLYRLKSAALTVADSSGKAVFVVPNILSRAVATSLYNATFSTRMILPADSYSVTLAVNDRTGNSYGVSDQFFVAPFLDVNIRILDPHNRPIEGAQLMLTTSGSNYTSTTNQTGWAEARVPTSSIVGPFRLEVYRSRLLILSSGALFLFANTEVSIIAEVYDLTMRVRILWFDLGGATIDLLADSATIATGVTDSSGNETFPQLPPRQYLAEIHYLGVVHRTKVNFTEPTFIVVQVPLPYETQLPYLVLVIAAVSAAGVMVRRRRVYRWPFHYIDLLTKGGLPDSLTTTIVGNSGSGKTVLMESIAYRSLESGRGCVYVTNVELPSNVRTTMKAMAMDVTEYEAKGKIIFIDCYSSLSGSRSREKKAVTSLTDLTSLGIFITRSIEEIGGVTDVYFDALTPLFTALRPEYVLSFLQSIGAKVKGYNGSLCTIIGTSVEKERLTKVEEISDCVIETQLAEGRSGQRRRLRIKKLRGHAYDDAWTRFKINDQGITFLTHKQPPPEW